MSKLTKLNSKTLDLLEDRFVRGLLGEVEVSGTTLEILRRVLHHNGRITVGVTPGDPGNLLDETTEDEFPFPHVVKG